MFSMGLYQHTTCLFDFLGEYLNDGRHAVRLLSLLHMYSRHSKTGGKWTNLSTPLWHHTLMIFHLFTLRVSCHSQWPLRDISYHDAPLYRSTVPAVYIYICLRTATFKMHTMYNCSYNFIKWSTIICGIIVQYKWLVNLTIVVFSIMQSALKRSVTSQYMYTLWV